MSAFPGLKAAEAAEALAAYLDRAGIVRTEDRIVALRRQYAVTWLDMLKTADKTTAFDIFDIHDGRDLLIERMEGL